MIIKLTPFLLIIAVVLGCKVPPSTNSTTRAAETWHPKIEFSKPKTSNEGGDVYSALNIEVKNVDTKPIEFLKVTASFYDKDDNFLRSEYIYIDRYASLGPGQRSPAKVMVNPPDRRIKSVRLAFTSHGEESFSEVDVDATEVDKIK